LAESSPHFLSAPGPLVIVGGRESDLALAGTAELAATPRHSYGDGAWWSSSIQTWTRPCALIDWLNIVVMVVAMATELLNPDASVFFSP
jgi:hypothetical protein